MLLITFFVFFIILISMHICIMKGSKILHNHTD